MASKDKSQYNLILINYHCTTFAAIDYKNYQMNMRERLIKALN